MFDIPPKGACKGKATIKDISEDPLLGRLEACLETLGPNPTGHEAIIKKHIEEAIRVHRSH